MSMSGAEDIDDVTMDRFIKVVHRLTGITLAKTRKTMLQGRLRPRMRELSLSSYSAYLTFLESNPDESNAFIDLITTNETYFYRTPRIWEYIAKELLPAWYLQHAGSVFNAWSAAASSGEEAHTLAILLQHFKVAHPQFQYQIIGTDISNEILEVSQKGCYSGKSIDFFKKTCPDLFKKYMHETTPDTFSVIPEVRAKMKFQQHNLFEKPKFGMAFDLILIRNVLIYFQERDQEAVLKNVGLALKKTGSLIIGESESLSRLNTPYTFKSPLIYGFGDAA